ncbi:MAG TPA: molybdopterin converting factor subunit 1 [Rhizomicrobium sp.]|nr:molybdopterin converting factor subunit 1 [Rhizomicrobium sp.]
MTVLYFAWVRQRLGTGEEQIELPPEIGTVRELAEHLQSRGGAFADVFSEPKRLRAAINQEHAAWDASLQTATEVAFFPPVTGG